MSTFVETTTHPPAHSETALARPILSPGLALKQAEQLIRAHSKTFYFATALLPGPARQGIRGLYGFCRATDDLVDTAQDRNLGLAEVEAWRAEVERPMAEQTHPILYTWVRVRETYSVNRRYEQELIDGVSMDIRFEPYATWADLERYCYRVAATVGLLSMPVIGLAEGATFEEASPYAIQLGIALQLTNILRDVGEDARSGRVYFPQEDLLRFGLTTQDILAGVSDERFIGLMRFEIERARALYRAALPGIKLLSPSAQPAVGAAALLYQAILTEIERLNYRVHQFRAQTTAWQKLTMLPAIIFTILTLKRPSTHHPF